MQERKMNEALLAEFPELRLKFDEYTSWQDGMDTGAFITYEDIFLPHIVAAVENEDFDFLRRVAVFLEKYLTQEGEYSSNVICVGILEGLKAKCDNEKVRLFLLKESRKQFDELVY